MEIITLTVGDLATNCYLVTDEDTGETLIIDPGDEGDFISTTLLEKKLIPQAIILTHGHYDHCLACLELKLNFNIPIYLHQADLFLYQKAHLSAPFWSNKTPHRVIPGLTRNPGLLTLPPIDHFLTDNQTITFGNSLLQVLHTTGHTPGSCSFLSIRNPKTSSRSPLSRGETAKPRGDQASLPVTLSLRMAWAAQITPTLPPPTSKNPSPNLEPLPLNIKLPFSFIPATKILVSRVLY